MFGRQVRLYVGKFDRGNDSSEFFDLSNLNFSFEITRSVEWYENSAVITIYNPSANTINRLMTEGNAVRIMAGYEDEGNLANVFIGQIAFVVPKRNGKNVTVEITCITDRGNFYQLSRLHCTFGFSKGMTIRKCLKELCDYANIALRAGTFPFLDEKLQHPFRVSGSFRFVVKEFTEYVLRPLNQCKIYLDNNEMIVFGKDNSMALEQIVLTHNSGLIECCPVRDETKNKVNFGDDPAYFMLSGTNQDVEPKKSPAVNIDRPLIVKGKEMMNPSIIPNSFAIIDSYDGSVYDAYLGVRGRFLITECKYMGGNFDNEFYVEFTAKEAPYKK